MFCFCKLTKQIKRLADAVEALVASIPPPLPNSVRLVLTGEGENGMLNYKLVLPAPGAADVASRKLTVNGVETILAGDALEAGGFSGNDNDSVAVSLIDVDDAGNSSPAREQTFTLTDTIAPAQPNELSLVVESET